MNTYIEGELVQGVVCGYFLVVRMENRGGLDGVVLKNVDPDDFTRVDHKRPLWMPTDCVKPYVKGGK